MPALTGKPSQTEETGFQLKEDTTPKEEKYPALPSDTYNVEIVEMSYRTPDNVTWEWPSWKKTKEEISIHFRVTDGQYTNRRLFWDAPFAPLDSKEGYKLKLALQELVQESPLPETFVFDTDYLDVYSGFQCRIRVEKVQNQAGKWVNKIREVLRPLEDTNTNGDFVDASDIF